MTDASIVARRVLKPFPADIVGELRTADPVSDGLSGAMILKLRTSVGEFCLRQWLPGMLPRDRIRLLHMMLRRMNDDGCGIVAAPLMSSRSNETLVVANDSDWHVEPWLPGQADFHKSPTNQRLRQGVRALASWHRHARAAVDRLPFNTWFANIVAPSPGIRERLGLTHWWTPARLTKLTQVISVETDAEWKAAATAISALYRELVPSVRHQLEEAANRQFSLQPCLRDVWHDHVLFDQGDVSGIIDPTAARVESPAADLARLVGSLVGDDRSAWDVAIDEYARHRPFSPDEQALVILFDRANVLLTGMNWLRWRYLQRSARPIDERALRRVQDDLGRMRVLAMNQ